MAVACAQSNPADRDAQILVQNVEETDAGYSNQFQSSNGIYKAETGQKVPADQSNRPVINAAGEFQWTDPEGNQHAVRYTADALGFHPESADIPAPVPLPAEHAQAHAEVLARARSFPQTVDESNPGAFPYEHDNRGAYVPVQYPEGLY